MVYAFKTGSHIRASAQAAGEMCEKLAEHGRLTAKNLVEENRPEDAPLHNEFEWDNDSAADLWREHQARHIIGCLIIEKKKEEPTRAFFSIVRNDPQYRHIETILTNRDETQALLKTAIDELSAFQRKYNRLKELVGVFDAIEEVKKYA